MKNTKIILLFLLFFTVKLYAQDYCMTAPVGYGAGTTGGGNVTPVTVSTYNDLKSNLTSSSAKVILVSGTITIPSNGQISLKSNKTLIGLPGAKLVSNDQTKDGSGILKMNGISNVIIRNLIFEGPGAYDIDGADLITNTGCTNLWVDHCEFYDGVDGNFDNTNNADKITISWCKFGYKKAYKAGGLETDDHRFTNLVGGGSSDYPTDGRYSITFQYCYWTDGCKSRMPRARNAQLHILNCYYNVTTKNTSGGNVSTTAIGLEAGTKGTDCYVESSNFKKISTIADCSYGGTPNLRMVNCIKGSNGATVTDKNGSTVSAPSYTYTVLPVAQVEAAVTGSCGAGATLYVTSTGEISSPCDPSATIESVGLNKVAFIQTEEQLMIRGIDVADVILYTVSGSKISHQKGANINIDFLSSGLYIAQIRTEAGNVFSRKFIK